MASNVYISDLRTSGLFRGRIGVFDRNVSTGALTIISGGTIETGLDGGLICVSHDGKNVYVVNQSNDTVSIFDRNFSTGELTSNGNIATGNIPVDICISYDGISLYVVNQGSAYISVYNRNISTGALTSGGTVSCEYSPQGIAVSSDGKNVYASNVQVSTVEVIGAISIFDRNVSTGELTANGTIPTGISDTDPYKICVSYDGVSLYVVNRLTDNIQAYDRNVSTGALTPFQSIATQDNPSDICISEDGISVYSLNTTSGTVSIYNRNVSTRALTSNGTIATESLPAVIKISSDSKNVYVINVTSATISVYDRNISTGALTLNSTNGFYGDPLVGLGVYPVVFDPSNPYCVSGAGLTSVNGTYNYVSTPAYNYDSGYWQKTSDSTKTFGYDYAAQWWVIKSGSSISYGMGDGTANALSPPPTNGILWGGGAIAPAPTITEGSCPSEIPTALMIDVQPYGVVSGDPFSTQPIIKIVNSDGDLIPTATNDVEVAITVVNGSGSLTGTTTVTAVDGYATFTDLVFTGAGSFYLTFTSTGLTEVDSDEIATLTPTELVVYVQPFASISGQLLSTQPTIKIANWLGDLVPDATDVVDVSLVDVTGSSVLTGTLNATASGGYAAFTDLIATGYGSFYLTFTSGTLTSVNSDTLFFPPDPGNPNPPIPVKPKRSYIPSSVPTSGDMETNEFAINVADKKGYVRDSNGIIHLVFDGNASGTGSVTSVGLSSTNSTLTISDSPVTTSGTIKIDLPETGVSAKAYTNADITIDVYGRITTASDGAVGVTSIIAGTGVSVDTATGDVTVTNSLPDQTVSLTNGTAISVTGTYPDFTITNDSPDQTVTLTDGTGISVTGTYPDFTITNSLPDQTVSLTEGTDITITGTYPDFTIAYSGVAGGVTSITAGTGISLDVSTGDVTITNSALDQTVSLTDGAGISVTGTYPDFTIASTITQYTDTDARKSISSTATGLTYTNTTGVFSLTSGYAIPTTTKQTNWDTAYTNRIISLTTIGSGAATLIANVLNIPNPQITSLTVTGNSGASTLSSGVLNVPTYTLSGLGGIKLTDLSSTATGLTYTNTTGVFSTTSGYAIPTTASQTNWDSAYTQRLQWDGGSTNLVAATGRTSLGLVIGTNVQAWDADLDAIAAISGTTGLLKKTAANTWSLDTSTYLTSNQTITLSGDVSGSGTTAITTTLATVPITKGGTGQITANAAVNALLPSQTSNSGKYLTTDGTNSSWGTVSSGTSIPSASMQMFAGAITQTVSAGVVTTTAPTGWLLCNGDAVSRSTYSALWTALGTTSSPYGQGDGSTTFNLPDLRSRVPLGVGTGSGLTARTLGGTVGTETETLTSSQIPAHSHPNTVSGGSTGLAGSHTHSLSKEVLTYVGSGGSRYDPYPGSVWTGSPAAGLILTTQPDHQHTFTPSITNANNTGGGGSHNNMQPSIGFNFIIKT